MAALGEAHGLQTPAQTQDIVTTSDIATASAVAQIARNTTTTSVDAQDRGLDSDPEDDEPVFDPATVKDSGKTAVELRFLAEKYASTGLSDTVVESLLNFHEEMETLIAIKALELGITVSDIERVFGKYVGVRRPSAWNRFLQSPLARATFKAARGVGNGKGMKALSQKWKSMTLEEKSVYKQATQEADPAVLNNFNDQLHDMGVGNQSRQSILQSRSNTVANAKNTKQYKEKAKSFVEETLSNAVQMVYSMDGVHDFLTRLQGLLVGQTPTDLKASITESARAFQSRIVKSLSSHLYETTKLRHWPWSKCDVTLNDAGYQLKLLPGARSVEQTFKEPSINLNRAKLLALEADLKDNLIQLVRLDRNPRFFEEREERRMHSKTDQSSQRNTSNSSLPDPVQNLFIDPRLNLPSNTSNTQDTQGTTQFDRSRQNHNPSPQ
ncbi:uncharacterized protein MELLADRAFT_91633 [Melampsora larici-populina 98AG31]|uniref:Uncharacterized protein n=1 Tax=Melampsora larici-populina (strain 98AG31 / pathotype 3-4-7) TaxID=747676 RepID=F4RZR7_MELLP|nr:uncharacterized protein MELLADRAFT_91633 [Melampsora larici-populina 98AG31]EGG02141.1 hypothetical protein MELLADRAFT_91633 [Melampsora larici-populina 98AG31]